MADISKFIISFLIIITSIKVNYGLIIDGDLSDQAGWYFLDKFCFVSENGKVEYEINYPVTYGQLNLLFYYDLEWPSVYPKKSMSCNEKELQISPFRILNLTGMNF